MLTEKDYCDYDICVALKELGYDEPCEGYYHLTDDEDYNQLSFEWCYDRDFLNSLNKWRAGVPMLCDAQKWLREKHNLHIEVRYYQNMWYEYELKEAEGKILAEGSAFKTYEEALSTAVYMATEHLKEK
jgi:hypothetical protein